MTSVQNRWLALPACVSLLCFVGSAAGQGVGTGAGIAQTQAMDPEWIDAHRPGSGVLLPRLLRDVKPNYTADAMRAKIQGVALLEGVVETDGTIQRVRTLRSLDAVHGLDREAAAALRQWRFQPGTKDGKPVPVIVVVELSFKLENTFSETAPLGLPVAFVATAPDDRTGDDSWELTPLEASPLAVAVAHPKGWAVRGVTDAVFIALAPDASFSLAMMPPIPTAREPLEPVTSGELGQAAAVIGSAYKRPVVATGQAQVANRLWIWFDLGVADANGSPAPSPESSPTHQWLFSSIVEKHQVVLVFTVRLMPGTDAQEREAQARRAGPIFARMLERMSFTRTP